MKVDPPPTPRIYIDSNIFIETFEGCSERSDRLAAWFDRLQLRPKTAVTSAFTIAEVLGRLGEFADWPSQKAFYVGLLVHKAFIDLRPTDEDILEGTGDLRRHARIVGRIIRLPDAIHIVTAQKSECAFFLSADGRLSGNLPVPMRHISPTLAGIDQLERLLDE